MGFEDVRSLARVAGMRLLTNDDGFALHPVGDFAGLEAFTHTIAGYICAIRWLANGRDTCPLEEILALEASH